MRTYYVRQKRESWSEDPEPARALNYQQLLDEVQASNDLMKQLKSDDSYVPCGCGIMTNGFTKLYVSAPGVSTFANTHYAGKYGKKAKDAWVTDLVRAITKNGNFVANAHAGKLRANMQYTLATKDHHGGMVIARISLFSGRVCETCSNPVPAHEFIEHKLIHGCHANAGKAPDDYQLIDSGHRDIMDVLSTTNVVPYVIAPTEYGVYVPKWIMQALAVYDQKEGFAGMPLAEYLKKMGPAPDTGPTGGTPDASS